MSVSNSSIPGIPFMPDFLLSYVEGYLLRRKHRLGESRTTNLLDQIIAWLGVEGSCPLLRHLIAGMESKVSTGY